MEGTVTGANTVAINTGTAIVDGKFYRNAASLDVNIPSAGSGKTRIDRIVLRADWDGFQVAVYRIEGTESSGTPSAPTKESSTGTLYDILLYQALVNSSGTVTLTDERTWAVPHCDESTLTTSAGELKIKPSGVTSTEIADAAVGNTELRHSAGFSVIGRSANSTGDVADITGTDGQVLRVLGTTLGFGTIATAGIGASQITNSLMADDAIDSAEIEDGAIDLAHMSANSVDSDQYVDGSIDLVHMSANSVDSDQYVDGSIDLAHMSAHSVDSPQYVHGSIDLEHMSANSVDSDQYVDGSIDHAHLASGIVETDNIAADAVTWQEAGSQLPFLTARFGGSATAWNSPGASSQTIDKVMFACGCIASSASGDVSVTLGFENIPLVFINAHTGLNEPVYILISSLAKTGFSFSVYNSADARLALTCFWIAIGQENEPV